MEIIKNITRQETKSMISFLHRMPMFIHPITRETIASFIHGVDLGRNTTPNWTFLLGEFISTQYKINGGTLGWPNQVEIYSKRKNLEWVDAFKNLMLQFQLHYLEGAAERKKCRRMPLYRTKYRMKSYRQLITIATWRFKLKNKYIYFKYVKHILVSVG